MSSSLAYRKNEDAIRRGIVPDKYLRVLPYVVGERVLEIGSAEGVLSLMLARRDGGAKMAVTGLEAREDRHFAAINLHQQWLARGSEFTCAPLFVQGRIGDRLSLLDSIDTLLAVRMIYYLRDEIDDVFAAIAAKVANVVLCGNRNRASRWRDGTIAEDDGLGEFNRYASGEGMCGLLVRHGYHIVDRQLDGDEIIVGKRNG